MIIAQKKYLGHRRAYSNIRPKSRCPGCKESINQTGHVPNHLEKAQLRSNADQPGVPVGTSANAKNMCYLVCCYQNVETRTLVCPRWGQRGRVMRSSYSYLVGESSKSSSRSRIKVALASRAPRDDWTLSRLKRRDLLRYGKKRSPLKQSPNRHLE